MNKRLFCTLILSFHISLNTFATTDGFYELYNNALALDSLGQFDEAISTIDSAIIFAKENELWEEMILYGIMQKADFLKQYDRLEKYYEVLQKGKTLTKQHYDNLSIYRDYLVYYFDYSIGYYYYRRGSQNRAQNAFDIMLEDQYAIEEIDYTCLTELSVMLGAIHRKKGNYSIALGFLKKAQEHYTKADKEYLEQGYQGYINKHLADVFHDLNQNDSASFYYKNAILSVKNTNLTDRTMKNRFIKYHNSFARHSIKNDQLNDALQLLKISLTEHSKNDAFYEETYRILGEVHAQQGNINQAKYYFNLSRKTSQFDTTNYKKAETDLAEGKMYAYLNQHQEALALYQKALTNLHDDFTDFSPHKNPENLKDIFAKKTLLDVLHHKSMALYELKEENSDYLQSSWKTIKLAIELFDNISKDNTADYDKQFLIKENYTIFEDAIRISLMQNQEEGIAYAFEVAEKSKANLLLAAVRNTQIQDYGVPDSLIDLEQDIKFQLINLAERRYEATKSKKATKKIDHDIAQYNKDLENLNQVLKRDFPSYFSLKNDRSVDNNDEIKSRLSENQVFVEYFIGEKNSYAFFMSKEQDLQVINIPINRMELTNLVQDFMQSIYLPYIDKNNPAVQKSQDKYSEKHTDAVYAKNGYILYDLLLRPVIATMDTEISKLQIIPDDVLNYLPFDALLQAEVPLNKVGYYENTNDYQYLATTHQISYCYSGTLLGLMQSETAAIAPKSELLIFEGLGFKNQTKSICDFFASMKFTKPFAHLLGASSNKENLMAQGKEFQYLHFSAHGIINNERPYQSHLQLRPSESNQNDSLLQLQTIYGLDLPAQMIILSACDAGVGPLQKGQGLISLARGFAYSGAKSLVTTLWSVNIGASNELMTNFYKYLSEGERKDEALFYAKKELIERDGTIRPFHWAGFVPIGNMAAVDMPLPLSRIVFAAVLGIFSLLLCVYFYRSFLKNQSS